MSDKFPKIAALFSTCCCSPCCTSSVLAFEAKALFFSVSSVISEGFVLIIMSNKNPSDSDEYSGAKWKHVVLTLKQKVEILKKSDKGKLVSKLREHSSLVRSGQRTCSSGTGEVRNLVPHLALFL